MAPRARYAIAAALAVIAAAAALVWWLTRPPVPGPLRLTPVGFADLPDWNAADPRAALAAFRRSCDEIGKRAPLSAMGGAGYAGVAGDWLAVCNAVPRNASAAGARRFFESWFAPVAVGAGEMREGLFTGYYEPQLRASRARHGPYQTPIYGLPNDLVTADLGQFRQSWKGEHLAGRIEGHRLVPYPDRADIDAHGLSTAKVLVYAADPVTAFFLQIQGSGRVTLDDGSAIRLAYAGANGRPYTAIGRTLIQNGELDRANVSLQTIRAWLKAHPDRAQGVMESDRSYVFFQEAPLGDPALGSAGSEGVPLTPRASLAVDPRLHPFGAPVYVAATAPDPDATKPDRPFAALLIAQDSGGAIGGPVRGDVYWGFGKAAESIAGRMKAHGTMFVLLPKPLAARLAPYTDYPPP